MKSGGFGRQNKEIRRFKRITKNNMAKLSVLADSQSPSVVGKKKKITQQKSCCYGNDDLNKNSNNININFGTSVENSHNNDNSGRSVGINELPKIDTIFNRSVPQRSTSLHPTAILYPANEVRRPSLVIPKVTIPSDVSSQQNVVAKEVNTQSLVGAINKRLVVDNKRPKYVPSVVRNYYPEFP